MSAPATSPLLCLAPAPIAVLGVPLDHLTMSEALGAVEQMVASREPHYLVTPNVDFLVQAQQDIELHRILCEADLVLCDGTPLLWASRLLGNALPERVAGADLVPLLIELAEKRKYRLFFLGSNPESATRAIANLQERFPGLVMAGYYAPPFNPLLEMDHDKIKSRILAAQPDILFVCFGCPKQEKFMAMHYRSLGVPVAVGVGGTLDFLAGALKRAPVWMRRSGTEWIFRLLQEPRRLFRRYHKDLWVFAWRLFLQWCRMSRAVAMRHSEYLPQASRGRAGVSAVSVMVDTARDDGPVPISVSKGIRPIRLHEIVCPERLDAATVRNLPTPGCPSANASESTSGGFSGELSALDRHLCLLSLAGTKFIDSTGIGFLIRWRKQVLQAGGQLVLLAPSQAVVRALALLHLQDLFPVAPTREAAREIAETLTRDETSVVDHPPEIDGTVTWRGELTAANAETVWLQTVDYLASLDFTHAWTIDLRDVRFIDSSGLGIIIRLKKLARQRGVGLNLTGFQEPVLNALRLAKLEKFLLGGVG
jgi:N-acetylglucosaminyldiphosphoundecaprenol N-acetyl-beta-D-mannosaminyltransferase